MPTKLLDFKILHIFELSDAYLGRRAEDNKTFKDIFREAP